jgi:phage replication initiation protein
MHASSLAVPIPPTSNHGGKTYRKPIHFDISQTAHIDWLGLTLPIPDDVENVPSWAVVQLARFGFSSVEDKRKGWFGYKHQHTIDEDCGLIAFGGDAQKNTLHIELTGKGCTVISNWTELRAWCRKVGAKITRIDLAHDDHTGMTANIETCRRWLRDGLFSMGKRPPKARLVDDLGSGDGCTLYVGSRAGGKLLRGYEKGKQLGDRQSPWFRLEVELRAKDRTIPLDVLTNPSPYLAGAFPALSFLSEVQNKIKTLKKATETSIGRAIDNARITVGKLVNVLGSKLGWEPLRIVQTLQRDGVPSRLKPYDRFLAPEGMT